jgi:hypothetical protein
MARGEFGAIPIFQYIKTATGQNIRHLTDTRHPHQTKLILPYVANRAEGGLHGWLAPRAAHRPCRQRAHGRQRGQRMDELSQDSSPK